MRRLTIAAAFLAMLLAGGCGAGTATQSTQPEETTAADTATGSTGPETIAEATTVPEKTAPATAAPAGWTAAIGDSVMLGAIDALQQEIPDLALIDAQGSRQPPAAIDVLRRRRAAGQLGDGVAVHVGNNGPFTEEQFDEMMRVLAGIGKVLIVNATVPPGVDTPIAVPNNHVLASGVQRYPNTVLVDWHAASANHPEFFGEDRTHLTLQGAQAYADLIAGYLRGPEEDSTAPPGPRERVYWGENGSSGQCIGPPSWCITTDEHDEAKSRNPS